MKKIDTKLDLAAIEEALDSNYAHFGYGEMMEHIRFLLSEVKRLTEQVEEAKEGWYLANGVTDLAMKHRDAAEAEVKRLSEQVGLITAKHIELGDKLPDIHAHDRWLIMENVIKSEPVLGDKS